MPTSSSQEFVGTAIGTVILIALADVLTAKEAG